MDVTDIQTVISALAGAAVTIISAYGAIRAKGIVLFPQEKIDSGKAKIAALTAGHETTKEVINAVGNISPEELAKIFAKGAEFSQNGCTVAEAQELGMMVIGAAKEK